MASEKQLAHLEKIRATKAAKQTPPNEESGEKIQSSSSLSFMTDDKVWFEGLLVALRNKEIKSANEVAAAVPIADEILRVYKAKFK